MSFQIMRKELNGTIVWHRFQMKSDSISIGHYDYVLSWAADGIAKPFRSWVNVNTKNVSRGSIDVQYAGADRQLPRPIIHKFKAKESILQPKRDFTVILKGSAIAPLIEVFCEVRLVAANHYNVDGEILIDHTYYDPE